jgi:hypothetical protein
MRRATQGEPKPVLRLVLLILLLIGIGIAASPLIVMPR